MVEEYVNQFDDGQIAINISGADFGAYNTLGSLLDQHSQLKPWTRGSWSKYLHDKAPEHWEYLVIDNRVGTAAHSNGGIEQEISVYDLIFCEDSVPDVDFESIFD